MPWQAAGVVDGAGQELLAGAAQKQQGPDHGFGETT
jgi:hypothetical protein